MNTKLKETIQALPKTVNAKRQALLKPLVAYLQKNIERNESIRLNFICTHNSRRSHLSQVWAQTMAFYFGIKNIFCYSGGTEATAVFPEVIETLIHQGFQIQKLSETSNPIYAVKYDSNEAPIICFSKTYNDNFNPKNTFGAIMTCNSANEACPVVLGAQARFSIQYDDPKIFDGTALQSEKYAERSLEIANEMFCVFDAVSK